MGPQLSEIICGPRVGLKANSSEDLWFSMNSGGIEVN